MWKDKALAEITNKFHTIMRQNPPVNVQEANMARTSFNPPNFKPMSPDFQKGKRHDGAPPPVNSLIGTRILTKERPYATVPPPRA